MNIIVKNFGNDSECSSISDLIQLLNTKYLNKSVSIHNNYNGIKSIYFVDVKENGIFNSYGPKEQFTFSKIK